MDQALYLGIEDNLMFECEVCPRKLLDVTFNLNILTSPFQLLGDRSNVVAISLNELYRLFKADPFN